MVVADGNKLLSNLLNAQKEILPEARVIFDVGAHHGQTTIDYFAMFQNAQIFAFEAEPDNIAVLKEALKPCSSRVQLFGNAITNQCGMVDFFVCTHNGTHSTFEPGDTSLWGSPETVKERIIVPSLTIDQFSHEKNIQHIDILAMDIQGGELDALRGASKLLKSHNISLLRLEVEFFYLYKNQPLFWEIGNYLSSFGYQFYGLYDCHFSKHNPNTLVWADAIFLSPNLTKLPNDVS